MSTHHLNYRPDIDGLRAVAVLSVIIYHAGFYWRGEKLLSGGFLGVDIFFVISGYLICSILLKELQAGKFSFANFYERRIRRILPALFLVMLCAAIVAPFLLPAKALPEFASSIIATGGFVSNFFFWLQDSYTAEPSLRKPLLHTWSLAVEEQFYLLFPLFLWLVWQRAAGKFMGALTIVAVASLLYAEWGSYYLPSANFYLLPARIWELLAGAILALMHARGKFKHIYGGLAWVGFALVLVSLITFDDAMRHPSMWTLLPVVGTVMMIMATPSSPYLNKLLSCKPLVGIGLISYSLYLWHQPVFAFERVYTGGELTVGHKFGLIGFCFLLAGLSWRFIETPFRRLDKLSRRVLLCSLGGCCVVLLSFALTISSVRSMAVIVASVLKTKATYPLCGARKPIYQGEERCLDLPMQKACTLTSGRGKSTWYLVGDSVADALSYPLWERLQARETNLTELTKGYCPFIPPNILVTVDGEIGRYGCSKSDSLARRKMLLAINPSVIVIHNLLHIYIHGSHDRRNLSSKIFRIQKNLRATSPLPMEKIRRHIHAAIEELLEHGHTVVLVYPIHAADFDLRHRRKELELLPPHQRQDLLTSARFSKSYQEFRKFTDVAYQIYDSLGEHKNLIRVLPEKLFCDPSSSGRCKVFEQDVALYGDFMHLSYYGACKLVSAIFAELPKELQANDEFTCQPICK